MEAIYGTHMQANAEQTQVTAREHGELTDMILLHLGPDKANGVTFTGSAEEITGLLERISAAVTDLAREVRVRARIEAELAS